MFVPLEAVAVGLFRKYVDGKKCRRYDIFEHGLKERRTMNLVA